MYLLGGSIMLWITSAIFSAVFAGLTSILAKCGIKKTDSDLATALRTIVVLIFSWVMVFIVGSQNTIKNIELTPLIFLILSGLATGASWLCYYKALQIGDASKVVPVDKLSVVITLVLAFVFLHEQFTYKSLIGCLLITVGTLVMVL
jgi:transporter family protein